MSRTTTLTVAIDISTKKATFGGQIAIREKVNLSVTGYGTAGASDLTVGLIYNETLLAVTNGLTTGTAYTGILDLNTTEAVAVFSNFPANTKVKISFVIWDITNSCLLVNDFIQVLNNPFITGMDDPTATGTIGNVDYAPLANGVTNGDSHDHSGGDGAQINHTGLSNIGTLTHAQIDTLLAFLQGTAALGTLRYYSGSWYIQDVDNVLLWHKLEAGGGSTGGFLVVGSGVAI